MSTFPLVPGDGARPLRPAGVSGPSRATGSAAPGRATGAPEASAGSDPRLAKAVRDFQALFLMELMKPLTETLNQSSLGEGDAGLGLSSGRDVYSYFWGEALARELAPGIPLPALERTAAAAESTAAEGAEGVEALTAEARARLLERMRAFAAPESRSAADLDFPPLAAPSGSSHDSARGRAADGIGPSRDAGSAASALSRNGPGSGLTGARSGFVPGSLRAAVAADATRVAAAGAGRRRAASLPTEIDQLAERAGKLLDVPVNLVRAVLQVESGGRKDAVSRSGAVGLMQLMPGTAKEMGVEDLRDPWQNVVGGVKYLAKQLERFGRTDHALAAYNAGPGAVRRHGGIPPFRETREYVRRVMAAKAGFDRSHPDGV